MAGHCKRSRIKGDSVTRHRRRGFVEWIHSNAPAHSEEGGTACHGQARPDLSQTPVVDPAAPRPAPTHGRHCEDPQGPRRPSVIPPPRERVLSAHILKARALRSWHTGFNAVPASASSAQGLTSMVAASAIRTTRAISRQRVAPSHPVRGATLPRPLAATLSRRLIGTGDRWNSSRS